MLTEDYFMRMINQMLAVLLKIIGLKEAGQHQEALEIIDQSLEQLLGIRPELLKQMDEPSLMNILTTQGELVSDRLYMVANLYKLEGDIFTDQDRLPEAKQDYQRALTFYLEIALRGEDQFSPEIHDKIEQLYSKLADQELPVELYFLLFDYYERRGNYASVESVISRLLTQPDHRGEINITVLAYYEGLLGKNDADLLAGGVIRSEIKAKIASFNPPGGAQSGR